MDRAEMEQEINGNQFLEYGEHSGNLYGTHLDSIRDVIKQGDDITKYSSLETRFSDAYSLQAKCASWIVLRVR